ncbi:MAG: hypothetical protein HYV59_07870 [Planctomycetes bacterium]|nr:hypothetical protein [Planctomycetota bacterium]
MKHTKRFEENIFADVIEKLQLLTVSQRKYLHEILSDKKKLSVASKKKLLKKSYGVWAERREIKTSIEYVNEIRKSWVSRLVG